ncbi:hypothetical protein [Caballeronia sp. INSB1]|uniref:glycine-rich domain-containing protein n=1 Tax=Caballeronia sp. INSB1 TaxID=2921751 RepID=UPI002032C979|nr:hypothetical protein [Caballeronia sp. INSB1]
MATSDFLPFAAGGSANVLSQSAYAALAAVTNGYQAGLANSAQMNKTFRQSSIMAAVLAQFIADQTGANSVDDGTTATLLANLKKATSGRLLNAQTFSASGTYTPTAGTNSVLVWVQGAGGGGGGCQGPSGAANSVISLSQGGGAGSFGMGRFTSGFSGVAVTVGQGGVGGSAGGGNGGSGGTSSFGALLSAPGGSAGLGATALSVPPAVTGGGNLSSTPSGANILSVQGPSAGPAFAFNGVTGSTAFGGKSFLGFGGATAFGTVANPGVLGGGGSGVGAPNSFSSGLAGGAGGNGLVIVYEFS